MDISNKQTVERDIEKEYAVIFSLVHEVSDAVEAVFNEEDETDAITIGLVAEMKQKLPDLQGKLDEYKSHQLSEKEAKFSVRGFYEIADPLLLSLVNLYQCLQDNVREKVEPLNMTYLNILVKNKATLEKRVEDYGVKTA